MLDTIDIGISIQDPNMTIIWANRTTRKEHGIESIEGQRCWMAYHRFACRSIACANCVAWRARLNTEARLDDGATDFPSTTGRMYLPIKRRIACVEVTAAPFLNWDRTKILAIIETTRFTKDWEVTSPAHERLQTVIDFAREMGCEHADAPPLASVAVYYRPEEEENENLFLFAVAKGTAVGRVAKVLRLNAMTPEQRKAITDGGSGFVRAGAPETSLSRFFWSGRTADGGVSVFIEVAYRGPKSPALLSDDLRPYWQYVLDVFDEALASREESWRRRTEAKLQEFLAQTAEAGRGTGQTKNDIVRSVLNCVKDVINPISMYVRLLDRDSMRLSKAAGFGFYYDEFAPQDRMLDKDGIGSGRVAARRVGFYWRNVKISEIEKLVNPSARAEYQVELSRISSYVTLPLIFSQRVLGTLCVQIEDDSLFSTANEQFLASVTNAFASALGRLEWIEERRRLTASLEHMDRMAFTPLPPGRQLEEEKRVAGAACRMVFETTAAEVVAYYQHQPFLQCMNLVDYFPAESRSESSQVPIRLDAGLEILQRAVNSPGGLFADFEDVQDQNLRDAFVESLGEGPERRFCERIARVVIHPVLVHDRPKGLLVAFSFLPHWISQEDVLTVAAYAHKIGLCLAARDQTQQILFHVQALETMLRISTAMGLTTAPFAVHRLLLLGVTTGECLGFSRATLFLRHEHADNQFVAVASVGASSLEAARIGWESANALSLDEKIELCGRLPTTPLVADLENETSNLVVDMAIHPDVLKDLDEGLVVVRHYGQKHVLSHGRLRALLSPEGECNFGYVLAPLRSTTTVGFVLSDRAFVDTPEISEESISLLRLLVNEWELSQWRLSRELRQQEQIAKRLAWGVSYSLRSRVSALESRLSNLKDELGGAYPEVITAMKRSVDFFKRAVMGSIQHIRTAELGLQRKTPVKLDDVLAEVIDVLGDRRIMLQRSSQPVVVLGDRKRIEDVCLELLQNACDFSDAKTGRIFVRLCTDKRMAQIDFVDNGPGIHPDIRPGLLKCSSAIRRPVWDWA